jgi:hypothetical protein
MMDWFWGQLIPEFCKVQFLCYGATPNWLGWIVLGWVGLMAAGLALAVLGGLMGK